jgi:small subunit ribosomal protein S20
MANHKATKKDTRQANKRRERNRYHGKTTRNAMRDLMAITVEGEAKDKLKTVEAMLDKLAKRNIIHKNKAANLKSALAKKVNAVGSTTEEVVKVKKATKKKNATGASKAAASKKAAVKKAATAKEAEKAASTDSEA